MADGKISGVLAVDKPEGWTSRKVVDRLQKILGVKKAGHAGTLDPLATGVLIVCFNEATKLVPYLMEGGKEYLVQMLLGVRTDTLDREGTVISREDPEVAPEGIAAVLEEFTGSIEQVAPAYSAVKYQGRPLYKWARQGVKIETRPRLVKVGEINLVSVDLPYVTFALSCSKGTYVRSLCSDIGERLGCGACMWSLKRTRSGGFSLAEAVSLTDENAGDLAGSLIERMVSIADALPQAKTVYVDEEFAGRLKEGRQPVAADFSGPHIPLFDPEDVVKLVQSDNRLVAIAKVLVGAKEIGLVAGDTRAASILRVFNE